MVEWLILMALGAIGINLATISWHLRDIAEALDE